METVQILPALHPRQGRLFFMQDRSCSTLQHVAALGLWDTMLYSVGMEKGKREINADFIKVENMWSVACLYLGSKFPKQQYHTSFTPKCL
jgi:hypothetical protein